jgi:hypothetical protein
VVAKFHHAVVITRSSAGRKQLQRQEQNLVTNTTSKQAEQTKNRMKPAPKQVNQQQRQSIIENPVVMDEFDLLIQEGMEQMEQRNTQSKSEYKKFRIIQYYNLLLSRRSNWGFELEWEFLRSKHSLYMK